MKRWLWASVLALAGTSGAVAQSTPRRVRVNVDYIAEKSLYISAGAAQGLFAGDTALAYREGAQVLLGRVLIASSTRSRAVALVVDSLRVAIGDVLELVPPDSAFARVRAAEALRADSAQKAGAVTVSRPVMQTTRRQAGVTLRGRIGFDVDALMTESRWGDTPELSDRFTYTTPVARLRATVAGMPGRTQLSTNLRMQYYGGERGRGAAYEARVYQASLERNVSFLRFQLGRFYNLYESHSGYWDGALLRLGGNGAGAGVAWGFTPLGGSEAFSTALPKTTAFIDLHHQGRSTRYDGSISYHEQTAEFVQGKRNFVGVSQQLGSHGIYLTERAQIGRTPQEDWGLWQLHSSLSLNLGRPVQLSARYSAERTDLLSEQPAASPMRVRATGGLSFSLGGLYASAEAGRVASGPGQEGRVYQGSLLIPRLLFGFGIGVNGSRWEEGDVVSTYLSPSIDRLFGRARLHIAGQYSNSAFQSAQYLQQGVEFSLAIPIAGRTEAMITASGTRSQNSTTTRILTSIWQSF